MNLLPLTLTIHESKASITPAERAAVLYKNCEFKIDRLHLSATTTTPVSDTVDVLFSKILSRNSNDELVLDEMNASVNRCVSSKFAATHF